MIDRRFNDIICAELILWILFLYDNTIIKNIRKTGHICHFVKKDTDCANCMYQFELLIAKLSVVNLFQINIDLSMYSFLWELLRQFLFLLNSKLQFTIQKKKLRPKLIWAYNYFNIICTILSFTFIYLLFNS